MPQPPPGHAPRAAEAEGDGNDRYVEDEGDLRRRRDPAERGLRGLVGTGPSQVGVIGAMRARDAARPSPEDIAAAEEELTIVRRYYVPPDGTTPGHPTGP